VPSPIKQAGSIHSTRQLHQPNEIVACLKRFSPEINSVGFEAGALTRYLTYGFQAAGYEVICLEARQVSVTHTRDNLK